jgi:hypothetical protein
LVCGLRDAAGKARALEPDCCKPVISARAVTLGRRFSAVVLGSGLLCAVPMPLLTDPFYRRVLVDVVHHSPVRRCCPLDREVNLLTRDLTGLLDRLGVADVASSAINAEGRAVGRVARLHGVAMAVPVEAWDWLVSAKGRGRRRPGDHPSRLGRWRLDVLIAPRMRGIRISRRRQRGPG